MNLFLPNLLRKTRPYTFDFQICFSQRRHALNRVQRWCVLQKKWFQTQWPFLLHVPFFLHSNFLTDVFSRAASAARIDLAPPACARKFLRLQAEPSEVQEWSGQQFTRSSRKFGAESLRVHRSIGGFFCRPLMNCCISSVRTEVQTLFGAQLRGFAPFLTNGAGPERGFWTKGCLFSYHWTKLFLPPWLQVAIDGKGNVNCPYRAPHIQLPNRLCATTPRIFLTFEHWKNSFFNLNQKIVIFNFLTIPRKSIVSIGCYYRHFLDLQNIVQYAKKKKTFFFRKKLGQCFALEIFLNRFLEKRPEFLCRVG